MQHLRSQSISRELFEINQDNDENLEDLRRDLMRLVSTSVPKLIFKRRANVKHCFLPSTSRSGTDNRAAGHADGMIGMAMLIASSMNFVKATCSKVSCACQFPKLNRSLTWPFCKMQMSTQDGKPMLNKTGKREMRNRMKRATSASRLAQPSGTIGPCSYV